MSDSDNSSDDDGRQLAPCAARKEDGSVCGGGMIFGAREGTIPFDYVVTCMTCGFQLAHNSESEARRLWNRAMAPREVSAVERVRSRDRDTWFGVLEALVDMTIQHCTTNDGCLSDMALSANEGAFYELKRLGIMNEREEIKPGWRDDPPILAAMEATP